MDWAGLLSSLSFCYRAYISQPAAPTPPRKSIPAPPVIDSVQDSEISYPPDAFPGARDVDLPYGKLRVYEWGPEDGRRVLLVHGISVLSLSLGAIAERLVDKNCRVMLFVEALLRNANWPTTGQSPFYNSPLLAITSSPIPWTNFSLIGYSLGGGIAASFTAHFPCLVHSLVLLAPVGLIRPHRFSLANRMFYSSRLLPESLLEWLVKRRLRGGPTNATAVTPKDVTAPAEQELPQKDGFDQAVLSKNRPNVTVAKVIAWQVQYNEGFVKSFISSIRYGPIATQHEDWRNIRKHLTMQKADVSLLSPPETKRESKILIICGLTDPVINYEELVEDATECLGAENVRIKTCNAGHELPITKSEEIVEYISDLWELNKS